MENRELVEKNRIQDLDIARITKEYVLMKEAVELETKLLHSSLMQAETNSKLLKAEKASKKQNVKANLLSALREIRKPLNRIAVCLESVFENQVFSDSLEGLRLKRRLKYIGACAHHQKFLIKSAIDLDTFITGNKKFQSKSFNPAQICRDAVRLQALSAREGVSIVLNSNLEDGAFKGTPSQLALVLSNLLSSAAMSSVAGKLGTVELRAKVVSDAYHYQDMSFSVTVADTGVGVPKEMQAAFFGSPGQLGKESEQIRAFGFGVFVAHEFVKRMKGALRLSSPGGHTEPTYIRREETGLGLAGGGGEGEGEGEKEEGDWGSEHSFQIRIRKAWSRREREDTPTPEQDQEEDVQPEESRTLKQEGEEPEEQNEQDSDCSLEEDGMLEERETGESTGSREREEEGDEDGEEEKVPSFGRSLTGFSRSGSAKIAVII